MQSQPNYGNFLSANYANYHINNFKKYYQVMFVTDPVEKINTFFTWNKESTDIEESSGFFIYYDKNKNMHNYILDNKVVKIKEHGQVKPAKIVTKKIIEDLEIEKQSEIDEEEENIVKFEKIEKSKVNNKIVSSLLAVSGLLFVISFVMGAGLVQNDERISKLETELNTIRTAYNGLVTYINENGATAVFAQSTPTVIVDNTETITKDYAKEEVALKEENTKIENSVNSEQQKDSEEKTEEKIEEKEVVAVSNINKNPIPKSYVIQKGDSLISISKNIYGTDEMTETIMELNNIKDPNKIFFGMVIKLPNKEE